MKQTFLLLIIVFGFLQTNENCGKKPTRNSNAAVTSTPSKNVGKTVFDRLPENVKSDTPVRKAIKNSKGETVSFEITTVEKTLNELKASYKNDRLVDGNGREIRFYEPLCHGVSRGMEEDEADQKAKEKELADLEKNNTVVVLNCDPRKQ